MTFEVIDRLVLENTTDIYSWHYAQAMIEQQSAPTEQIAPALPVVPLLTTIWLVGLALSGLFFIVLYVKQRRKFLTSLPLENEFLANWQQTHKLKRQIRVRSSDQIATPLTYGILSPVILLPKNMNWLDEKGLSHILAHELIHIKRFDALKKLLLAAVLCVHWFNPLVWLMYILFNRDLELACDEGVIRLFGEEAKPQYAFTLISAQEQLAYPPLHNAFGKYAIEERIHAIMRSRKASFAGILAAFLLVVSITMIFATSAAADSSYDLSARMIVLTNTPGDELICAEEAAAIGRMAFTRYFPAFATDWDTWDDITFLMTFSPAVDPRTLHEGRGIHTIPAWQGLVVVESDIGLEHIFPFSFFIHARTGEVLHMSYTPRTNYALELEASARLGGESAVMAMFRAWNEAHPGFRQGSYNDMFLALARQTAQDLRFFDSEIASIAMHSTRTMASGLAGVVLVEYTSGDFVQLEFLLLEQELISVRYVRTVALYLANMKP